MKTKNRLAERNEKAQNVLRKMMMEKKKKMEG